MANDDSEVTRRVLLRSAALTGVAVPLLAACGSDSDEGAGVPAITAGTVLASTSDVPVGEGIVLSEEKVVITQPSQGQFMAFTAICTHKGCTVEEVAGGTINCPCHGSKFNIDDGSVADGPAEEPLEEIPVSVEGGTIAVS